MEEYRQEIILSAILSTWRFVSSLASGPCVAHIQAATSLLPAEAWPYRRRTRDLLKHLSGFGFVGGPGLVYTQG